MSPACGACEIADNQYWSNLIAYDMETRPDKAALLQTIQQQYKMAYLKAISYQLNVISPDANSLTALFGNLLRQMGDNRQLHANVPPARISEAFDFYCEKIAFRDLIGKSPNQKKVWLSTKKSSVKNFIHVIGDKYMSEITRDDGHKFYGSWASRMVAKQGGRRVSAASGNKDMGNIRKFYRDYYTYFGQETQPNPLRSLSFKSMPSGNKRPAVADEWVRDKLLQPDALSHIKEEARFILYTLIETGCRISEVINLGPTDIILGTDAPFIKIRPTANREVKSPAAVRDIPLVGVALEALTRYPRGFKRYRDQGTLVSKYLLRGLRQHGLMPSESHVIYSFRHSFEQRMLEAGLDYGLRCRLMGHAVARPDYGGTSMRWRHEQLMKIAHPYSQALFY